MDVALIRWPGDEERRAQLAARRDPRLLLVSEDFPPPDCSDELEDWVRLPVQPEDVKARVENLMARTQATTPGLVRIDENGWVTYRSSRVELTPHQADLLEPLKERFGVVVSRAELVTAGWPGEPPSANALEASIARLRQRLSPLGLRIRTVRSRGYLLESEGQL